MQTQYSTSPTIPQDLPAMRYFSHYWQHAEHSIRQNTYSDQSVTYSTRIGSQTVEVEMITDRSATCYIASHSTQNRVYTLAVSENRQHFQSNALGYVFHCQCVAFSYHHDCSHTHAAQEAFRLVRDFVRHVERRNRQIDREAWEDLMFREFCARLEVAQ